MDIATFRPTDGKKLLIDFLNGSNINIFYAYLLNRNQVYVKPFLLKISLKNRWL